MHPDPHICLGHVIRAAIAENDKPIKPQPHRLGGFDNADDLVDELWRRAVPYMLLSAGFIAGFAACGALLSWGWL